MRFALLLFTVAFLLDACAASHKGSKVAAVGETDQEAAVEEYTLKFAWPAGGTAAYVRESCDTVGNAAEEITKITYTITTEPAGYGRVVLRYSDPRDLQMDGVAEEDTADLARVLGAMVPHMVIGADGHIESLERTDQVREIMDQVYPIPADADDQMRAALLASRSDEGLLGSARAEWRPIVGFWNGKSLGVGQAYRGTGKSAFPLGNAPVDAVVTYGLKEIKECPGDESKKCAVLFYNSELEPNSLKKAMEGFVAVAGRRGDTVEFGALEHTQQFELITELETLRPVVYARTDLTKVHLTVNGEHQGSQKVSRKLEGYRWTDPEG